MELTHVRLLVADVRSSVAYYRDVLGLEVTLEAGEIYAELRAGAAIVGIYRADLMASRIDAVSRTGDASGDAMCLTFEVEDVDRAFEELRRRGAAIETEPHDHAEAFLRAAHVRDPDGNLIEINAPLRD